MAADGAAGLQGPRRVISMAPSITEILFALGLGDRVVGVTDFCDWPPEASEKQRIGGFLNTNYEAIVMLKPDLVICLSDQRDTLDKLSGLGIRTLVVSMKTIEKLNQSIDDISRAFGVPEQGARLRSKIEADLDAVRSATAGLPRPRTLVCVGHSLGTLQDLFAAGPNSFLGQLLEIAGGENILKSQSIPFPWVSKETVIVGDPEVILVMLTQSGQQTDREIERELWATLGPLSAVKNDRVYVHSAQGVAVAGPRVGELARLMALSIHPEIEDRLGQPNTLVKVQGGAR